MLCKSHRFGECASARLTARCFACSELERDTRIRWRAASWDKRQNLMGLEALCFLDFLLTWFICRVSVRYGAVHTTDILVCRALYNLANTREKHRLIQARGGSS
jgi:hypothetical protein